MSATRRLVAIPILGAALTLIAFGVVRGASHAGPGHGVRMIVAIDPPVDAAALAMAEHVVRERVEEKGVETKVVPAGDRLVVELGDEDPEIVRMTAELLERTAPLEFRAAETGELLLAGRAIKRAQVESGGVSLDVSDPAALSRATRGAVIKVVFAGKERFTGTIDRVAGTALHVRVPGANEDDAIRKALELVTMIEAGAVHPLHVGERTPFTRATGFLPRAWPFFVAGAVLLVVAALMWRRTPVPG